MKLILNFHLYPLSSWRNRSRNCRIHDPIWLLCCTPTTGSVQWLDQLISESKCICSSKCIIARSSSSIMASEKSLQLIVIITLGIELIIHTYWWKVKNFGLHRRISQRRHKIMKRIKEGWKKIINFFCYIYLLLSR